MAADIAELLGDGQAAWLLERAETVRKAFAGTFLDADTGRVVAREPVSSPAAAGRFAPSVADGVHRQRVPCWTRWPARVISAWSASFSSAVNSPPSAT